MYLFFFSNFMIFFKYKESGKRSSVFPIMIFCTKRLKWTIRCVFLFRYCCYTRNFIYAKIILYKQSQPIFQTATSFSLFKLIFLLNFKENFKDGALSAFLPSVGRGSYRSRKLNVFLYSEQLCFEIISLIINN